MLTNLQCPQLFNFVSHWHICSDIPLYPLPQLIILSVSLTSAQVHSWIRTERDEPSSLRTNPITAWPDGRKAKLCLLPFNHTGAPIHIGTAWISGIKCIPSTQGMGDSNRSPRSMWGSTSQQQYLLDQLKNLQHSDKSKPVGIVVTCIDTVLPAVQVNHSIHEYNQTGTSIASREKREM